MQIAEMLPAIIDIEASGFGRGSYPIEVGFVLPDGTSFCSLIRPPTHWTHWDAEAAALHRITLEQLAEHGRPPAEVAAMLNQRLQGRVVYSNGWANDYTWLALLYEESHALPAFKLENLRTLLSEDEVARWHPAHDAVLAEASWSRHRASADARALQSTVMRIRHEAQAVR